MQTFKDRNGREWGIEITVGSIKRVRDAVKVNLYDLIDDNFAGLRRLLDNPIDLVDVVFVLCEQNAKASGINDVQFGESLSGESISEMADAFTQAFIDFFPDRRRAAVLQKLVAKAKETAAAICEESEKAIESLDVSAVVASLRGKSGLPPASSA
jgi:hypothetical protein